MKKIFKKGLIFALLFCMAIPCAVMSACKNEEKGMTANKWHNALNLYAFSGLTVYEYQSGQAFSFDYQGEPDKIINDQPCIYQLNVSDSFKGHTVDDARIQSIQALYYMNSAQENVNWKNEAVNGQWYNEQGERVYVHEDYTGESPLNPKLYYWLIRWAQENKDAFEKTVTEGDRVTYQLLGERISEVEGEITKTYSNASVKAMVITFERPNKYDNNSDPYKLVSVSVSDATELLFAIKHFNGIIRQSSYEILRYNLYKYANFTLKGGEGVDYGEYYFTENAVRIYTPNNTNEAQKEAYLTVDYENNSAKYITKTAGRWSAQTISVGEYESRRNTLIDMYLGGILEDGYSCFDKYFESIDDIVQPMWHAEEIDSRFGLYAIKYENVVVKFTGVAFSNQANTMIVREMSFDYQLTSSGASVKYHYELTNGGSTVLTPPAV